MREIARDIHRNRKEEIEGDAKSGVRPGCAEEGTYEVRGRQRRADEGDRNSYANLEEMPL